MNYKTLVETYWPRQTQLLELLLKDELKTGSKDIVSAVKHQVLSGGKRLRAVLPISTFLSFKTEHSFSEQSILWAGLATELLHNATLCHDDIMDGDEMRRGVPTVWVKFGMPQGINTGALLYSLADEALHQMDIPAQETLFALHSLERRARYVIHGQAQELVLRRDCLLPTSDTYTHIIAGKTGSLFVLCFQLGALLAASPKSQWPALEKLGFQLGELFQIQDDLLDLIGDKGRGETACDIWEGKPSWLITHCAHHLSKDKRLELKKLLYIPRVEKEESQVEAILTYIEATGSISAGLTLFQKLREDILASVETELHPLADLIQEFVQRISAPIEHALKG